MELQKHGIFCRVQTYGHQVSSKKAEGRTLSQVINEALRVDGFCDHVTEPLQPTIVYGDSPQKMLKELEKRSKLSTTSYFHKPSGQVRKRRKRRDSAVATCGVISVPPDWKDTEPRWHAFILKSIEFLIKEFGESRLRSVVKHQDERCLHLHFFLCPLADEPISVVHPGRFAIGELPKDASPLNRKHAFTNAMSEFLDRFFTQVGQEFGLLRRHIGAKRMLRKDWHIWRWSREQLRHHREQRLKHKHRLTDMEWLAISSYQGKRWITFPSQVEANFESQAQKPRPPEGNQDLTSASCEPEALPPDTPHEWSYQDNDEDFSEDEFESPRPRC